MDKEAHKMFDYITLIFAVVLLLGLVIGFARGGFKTLGGLIVLALAIVLAVFLTKPIGNALNGSGLGTATYNGLFDFIKTSIKVEVAPGVTYTGETQVTADQLAAYQAAYGKPIWEVIYTQMNLPAIFANKVSEIIGNTVASYGNQPFALAAPIATILKSAVIYGGTFLAIFLAGLIVFGIIFAIVKAVIRSKNGNEKPHIGFVNRIVGAILGLAIAGAAVWACCLSFNLMMLMNNGTGNYLKEVLHMTEGDTTWTLAKWLTQTNFGYQAVIEFFIGDISSGAAAASSAISSIA